MNEWLIIPEQSGIIFSEVFEGLLSPSVSSRKISLMENINKYCLSDGYSLRMRDFPIRALSLKRYYRRLFYFFFILN